MRCARDHFSLDAAAEKNRELPTWYLEGPDLEAGDEFYLKAWRDLHTCRSLGAMGPGPIPWTDVVYYSERMGIDSDFVDSFVYIIRAMDVAYLNWIVKEEERLRDNKGK